VDRKTPRESSAINTMTKKNKMMWILALPMIVFIAGCDDHKPSSRPSPEATSNPAPSLPAPSAPASVTDQWTGKWIGPEGTYLVLSKNGDKYVVEIHSLDGSQSYEGTLAGDRINFQRNGKAESVRAGNGQDTGMKWLLDKKNCLIFKAGEGFCRD